GPQRRDRPRGGLRRAPDRRGDDAPGCAHRVRVHRPDEPGSDDRGTKSLGHCHFLRASATATMMIRPRMICCWLLSNPARISPLLIRPMSSEPTSAPMMLPAPPNRLVPPRMTAAM